MSLRLEAACFNSTGKVRANNEDNFYFSDTTLEQENDGLLSPIYGMIEDDIVCFGVFDGMGGAEDGQVASHLAASSLKNDVFSANESAILSETFFLEAVEHMNTAVYMEAEKQKNNMGTTAVMFGFDKSSVYVSNVGDSRAYRWRDGHLVQISMDHVAPIPAYEAKTRRKPYLSQCIGIPPDKLKLEPYFARGTLQMGDIYLLCSDGLTDMVSESSIADCLCESKRIDVHARQLVELALDNGGHDNVTVIIIRVLECDQIDSDDI